jgi:hypothetical protein
MGLIALFAGVALIFGGIVAANQAGLFSDDGASGEVRSCEEVFTGSQVHEHARLEVYLGSDQPYDFSAERYQVADPRVHFEHGQRDANGARIHVHEPRPTLGCLFETLNWNVGPDRIETDTGEVYQANGEGEIEVLVGGEPIDRGFNEPIVGQEQYVVRWTPSDAGGDQTNSS